MLCKLFKVGIDALYKIDRKKDLFEKSLYLFGDLLNNGTSKTEERLVN